MADGCVDLTVTSPPYDDLRKYGDSYHFDIKDIASQLFRITKRGGVVVWVVGDGYVDGGETLTSFRHAIDFKECGFTVHDTMIYEKSAFANPSSNRYHQIFEYMFVFSKGQPKTFNPLKDRRNNDINDFGKSRRNKSGEMINQHDKTRLSLSPYGMRFNIWRYATGYGNSTRDEMAFRHPAIFPENLARDHILTWSNIGDIVFDPFLGSGTVAKMAYLLRRRYIGVDISQDYCNISDIRLEKYKGKQYSVDKINLLYGPGQKVSGPLDKMVLKKRCT